LRADPFDLRDIPAQPWKNGAGLTREIAVGPRGAAGTDFDWRFSVAEVERAAPFSAFPGIDRCIVLLAGAGLHLRSADGQIDHRLDDPQQPFHFPGDVPLAAGLLGGPSTDFNLMMRRGAWRSVVACHGVAAHLPAAGVALLLCGAGAWRADAGPVLQPGQGLLWRNGAPSIHIEPATSAGAAARLVCVQLLPTRLCQDAAS
jgi:environmental stress-induced protein Ves